MPYAQSDWIEASDMPAIGNALDKQKDDGTTTPKNEIMGASHIQFAVRQPLKPNTKVSPTIGNLETHKIQQLKHLHKKPGVRHSILGRSQPRDEHDQ